MTVVNNGTIQNQINISDFEEPSKDEKEFAKKIRGIYGFRDPKLLRNIMRANLEGRGFKESLKALDISYEAHKDAARDGGESYFIHPFTMARTALMNPESDDNLIATILLHDVVEDTDRTVDSLNVNDVIKYAVSLITKDKCDDPTKKQIMTEIYIHNLRKSVYALIGKGYDSLNNLNTMEGALSLKRKKKKIIETHELLIPELQRAKTDPMFTDFRSTLSSLRQELKIRVMNGAIVHRIELRPINDLT